MVLKDLVMARNCKLYFSCLSIVSEVSVVAEVTDIGVVKAEVFL